jgi:hypothetical protein
MMSLLPNPIRRVSGTAGAAGALLVGLWLWHSMDLRAAGSISLTAGGVYVENFDTLASSGTSSLTPLGWAFVESGTNANDTYAAGTGSSNTGNTYSFGASGSTERAFGGLLSGSLNPTIGAQFTNDTGDVITSVQIAYTGEQWRLGATGRGADRLDFQYSLDATSLGTGTWIDVDALDFSGPVSAGPVGLLDGNAAGNRTAISATLSGLAIPSGSTFWIRWVDLNVASSDDGLAVDDLSVTFPFAPTPPVGIGAAAPSTVSAGDQTLLTVTVTPGVNPPSTGLAVTGDLSGIGGAAFQPFFNDGTNGDLTAGDGIFSYQPTVAASVSTGAKLLPFTVADAESRSTSGAIALTVSSPPIPIHEIQGAGPESPYVGQTVTTRGVVTARRFNNGFFVQTPDGMADADALTSEGIFVFTSVAPPALAAVGAYVQVTGTVQEYIPAADPSSPSLTEITGPIVAVRPEIVAIPAAVTLTADDLTAINTLANLERFEGMRVHVPSLRVVAPTAGSVSETNATGSSDGVFYGVIGDMGRPFREPGIDTLDALPAGAPPAVPRFDGNPQRLRIASWGQIGSTRLEVTTGALVSNITGPLDFGWRAWTILPDPTPAVSGNATAMPMPEPAATEFTVASFNMQRFFDTVNDPAVGEPVLSDAAFKRRLAKASLAIRTVMYWPDILGVEEVENLSTLQTLAARLNADAVAAGDPNPEYVAYLEEGNDPGGIDVGYLVKSARVDVVSVTQEGKDATFTDPTDGSLDLLNDRPPLVLDALVQGPVGAMPMTVIVNHLRSLNGLDDPADGPRVRAKRAAQAEFLAALIQARQAANPFERIVSVGDYNAYEFNDGHVDVIGTIKGTPTPPEYVVLASGDLVDPDLTDVVDLDLVPASERYSYVFDGSAQVLDHIIVNDHARQRLSRVHYTRSNADFPESYRSDGTRPERLSDHDVPVAYFVFPEAPKVVLNGANPMTVELGSPFLDPGATATDEDFGVLPVSVAGFVDPNALGTYTLTYSATNGYLTTVVTREVHVVDTTPPAISPVTPSLASLWPANHKMVAVSLSYTVSDIDGVQGCWLNVTSNEPINSLADGDTWPDWTIVDATSVLLRAERTGTGEGRFYTITVACADPTGNSSVATTVVIVPKSQGKQP